VRTTLVVALATAIALSITGSASAASRTAYFKVSLVAKQDVSWNKHLTFPSCGGGTIQMEGNGTSAIRVRTPRAQPAVAQRVKGGRIILRFRGGGALLPVEGTITRNGVSYATGGGTTKDPSCGRPEPPITPDCGTKQYPSGAAIGVAYYSPQDWPYDSGPPPLIPSIALSGPTASQWHGIVYQWCPGANGDDVLRGPVYENEAAHSSAGGLPPARLFGTLRSFRVTGHSLETVDTAKMGGFTGTFPITTKTKWTLTFTRLAHRPSGL
jgi:hypothetical protein